MVADFGATTLVARTTIVVTAGCSAATLQEHQGQVSGQLCDGAVMMVPENLMDRVDEVK
jgi:hypothetical protein